MPQHSNVAERVNDQAKGKGFLHNERFTFNIKNNDSDINISIFSLSERERGKKERVDGWIDFDLKWFILEVLKKSVKIHTCLK